MSEGDRPLFQDRDVPAQDALGGPFASYLQRVLKPPSISLPTSQTPGRTQTSEPGQLRSLSWRLWGEGGAGVVEALQGPYPLIQGRKDRDLGLRSSITGHRPAQPPGASRRGPLPLLRTRTQAQPGRGPGSKTRTPGFLRPLTHGHPSPRASCRPASPAAGLGLQHLWQSRDLCAAPPSPPYLLQGPGQDPSVLVVLRGPRHGVSLASACLPITHDGACQHFKKTTR